MNIKKISRRQVTLGLAIAGMAAAVAFVHVLKSRNGLPIPSAGMGTLKVTREYRGRDITLDVPLKLPTTPEEEMELQEQLLTQLKENPIYIEVETESFKKRMAERRKQTIADYAEHEKRLLAELAKQQASESQKKAAAKAIQEQIRAGKARSLDLIDKLTGDNIAKLSQP